MKGVDMGALRRVKLPGSAGRTTSQLGFGCSWLMYANVDATRSRRLLDAAWDAGIRHFDVARTYGGGRSEGVVGGFLREHSDATVTTKYGLFPQSITRTFALKVQRHAPLLKNWQPIKPRYHVLGRFNAAEARKSLALSSRLLGRDFIDLFLLHEPTPALLVHDDLLAFLESAKAEGRIGEYGIGGEYERIPELWAKRESYCRVLQFEWSILGPSLDLPGVYRSHYRPFSNASVSLGKRFEQDPAIARNWSDVTGSDLKDPAILRGLLLKAALDAYPESPTLFSSGKEDHIFDNVKIAEDAAMSEPAALLAALIRQDTART